MTREIECIPRKNAEYNLFHRSFHLQASDLHFHRTLLVKSSYQMTCPAILRSPINDHALASSKVDSGPGRSPREITELQKILRVAIFNLRLYNFKISTDETNPPLPQMAPFKPYSESDSDQMMIRHSADSDPARFFRVHLRRSSFRRRSRYRYYNEIFSNPHGESSGETDLLSELNNLSRGGHLCFTGPAGSGKSTLLRILARNTADGLNDFPEFDLVHIINHQPFAEDTKCSASHALFHMPANHFSEEEERSLFSFAAECPDKVLLILDSLDTLPHDLSETPEDFDDAYLPERPCLPMIHVKMLLSGKLLPGCRVVSSSRPHAITLFWVGSIPTRCVFLRGFSESDFEKVLTLYSPENANEIFNVIVKERPQLFYLFNEPVFLVFLVKIWQETRVSQQTAAFDRMGATEVLIKVINSFYEHGEHVQGNYEKLSNVKKMARGTLWRKQLEFDKTSLGDYDLQIQDLTDLCTTALHERGNQMLVKLTNGNSQIVFSHQSIHEMLAALNVVESNFISFQEKIEKLHQAFFQKTRDLVYGLVFKKHQSPLIKTDIRDIEKKQKILKESIEKEFRTASRVEQLRLFETLAEAINEDQKFDLKTAHGVNLSSIPLSNWNLYCTGTSISQFSMLQTLHLEHCALRPSHLRALECGLLKFSNEKLQILSFSLYGNKEIGNDGLEIACRIACVRNVNEFNIGRCGLDSDCVKQIYRNLQGTTLISLVLKKNRIGKDGLVFAGMIVKQCSVRNVNLSGCARTLEEAKAFGETANGLKINRLTAIGNDGKVVCGYGNVIRLCSLRTLVLSVLALNPEDATKMTELSENSKVSKLRLVSTTGIEDMLMLGSHKVDETAACETIRRLMPIVRDEIQFALPLHNDTVAKLQGHLENFQSEALIIRLGRDCSIIISKRKILHDAAAENEAEGDIDDEENVGNGGIESLTTEREIEEFTKMQKGYLDGSNGCHTISWLLKYKSRPKLIADVLKTHGLSIHRYEMKQEDCTVVAELLSECHKQKVDLKSFSFTYSSGLDDFLDALKKLDHYPKIANISFAGYADINQSLSRLFVDLIKLFRAEGIILISNNVSYDGLKALENEIREGKEKLGNFNRLEIFHNADLGNKAWDCLADIAKKSRNPLHIAACYCEVTGERLAAFWKRLRPDKTRIGSIDLCGNTDLAISDGFQTLGKIVKHCRIPSVSLEECNLDAEKFILFNQGYEIESPTTAKIASLNVSHNPYLGQDGLEELVRTIKGCGVQNLNISYSELEEIHLQMEFDSLDISGNPRCKNISILAGLAKRRLYIRDCLLSKYELKTIALALKENQQQKLELLDVSEDIKEIDRDDEEYLVELFKDVTESITVSKHVTLST